MEIKRNRYLNRLIGKKNNGLVKVITGIRRSGKSYLLFNLYYDYLISVGVPESNIILISLDDEEYTSYAFSPSDNTTLSISFRFIPARLFISIPYALSMLIPVEWPFMSSF